MPVSAITALQALRDRGRLEADQQVLVIVASGGVGTFAVQIAHALGATVTGVCSSAKVDLVRSLGAERVIDYTQAEITDDGGATTSCSTSAATARCRCCAAFSRAKGRSSSWAAKGETASPAASTANSGP